MNSEHVTTERPFEPFPGWPALGLWLLVTAGLVTALVLGDDVLRVGAGIAAAIHFVLAFGFFIVEPNMSRVMVLFGKYKGTVRRDGFGWANPLMLKKGVSLRAHNLDGEKLKVNDLMGNPIEISAVVVWRVNDTARAVFDVVDYEHFVRVQSDAALRNLATTHPYDKGMTSDVSTTLRGSTDVVAQELEEQLAARLEQAGVEILEARLNHLAYAPEIASAMLQRQQARAIVSARKQIVEGAVGMVEDALERLRTDAIIELDDERRATLVGNLLVVLCGHATPAPVINAGSLYN